jgi:hypothetical protein
MISKKAYTDYWGEPCDDYDKNCPACAAWDTWTSITGEEIVYLNVRYPIDYESGEIDESNSDSPLPPASEEEKILVVYLMTLSRYKEAVARMTKLNTDDVIWCLDEVKKLTNAITIG